MAPVLSPSPAHSFPRCRHPETTAPKTGLEAAKRQISASSRFVASFVATSSASPLPSSRQLSSESVSSSSIAFNFLTCLLGAIASSSWFFAGGPTGQVKDAGAFVLATRSSGERKKTVDITASFCWKVTDGCLMPRRFHEHLFKRESIGRESV